jgi:sugar phosphate isomerase/epimerase
MSKIRKLSRRRFLRGVVATSLVAPSFGLLASEALATNRRLPNSALAQQWFMIRTELDRDFEGTWAAIADLGYRKIELGPGLFGRSAAELRQFFDSLELKVVSRMLSPDIVRNNLDAAMEDSAVLGVRYLRTNSVPDAERTLDGYRNFARDLNVAGAAARDAGFQFGHHNHLYEFQPIDGVVPMDLLLAETDPRLVDLQLDIGWAVRAGVDVVEFMTANPHRVGTFHLKDVAPDGSEADIGAGTVDWAAIYDIAYRQGVRLSIVDLDNPADPMASVTNSYTYLRQLTF